MKQPKTLSELLSLGVGELDKVDIARMNLLCAEGLPGAEYLDVEAALERLEAWTLHVQNETKRMYPNYLERPEHYERTLPRFRMAMIGTVLFQDLQIKYSPKLEKLIEEITKEPSHEKWAVFFTDASDVFLHGLLDGRKQGTCASMPFLYASIARRLGYPVNIAARLNHLYVRYEESPNSHFNVEATENSGFATPSDDDYRKEPFPMTDEQIQGLGFLRPLSNKEALGICLENRASCLRSNGRHEEEIATRIAAERYLPNTAISKRIIQKSIALARNFANLKKWEELWTQIESEQFPIAGPRHEFFAGKKVQVENLMNTGTNIVEMEQAVTLLRMQLRNYRSELSDDPATIAKYFRLSTPNSLQPAYDAILGDILFAGGKTMRIPIERIPSAYCYDIPLELMERLTRLRSPEEIVQEMQTFNAEEMSLNALAAMEEAKRHREEMALHPSLKRSYQLTATQAKNAALLKQANQYENFRKHVEQRRMLLDLDSGPRWRQFEFFSEEEAKQ